METEKEHRNYSDFYKHISSEYTVKSALFRFMVLAETGNCFSNQAIFKTDEIETFLNDVEQYIKRKGDDPDFDTHGQELQSMFSAFRSKEDKSIKTLDFASLNYINTMPMSQRLERLMFMYGADVITPPMFKRLSNIPENTDIDSILKDGEDFLIKQAQIENDHLSEQSALSETTFRKILECAIKSKEEDGNHSLSFSEAKELVDNSKLLDIYDGRVKVIDKGFFIFLAKQNERFAYDRNGSKIIEEPFNILYEPNSVDEHVEITDELEEEITEQIDKNSAETVPVPAEQQNNANNQCTPKLNDTIEEVFTTNKYDSEYFPFISRPKRLLVFTKLYGQPYLEEFLEYMRDFIDVSFEEYPNKYKSFVNELLFTYEISSLDRKRNVCGDVPNWFDYNTSLKENESPQLHKVSIAPNTSGEDENIRLALRKYIDTYAVGNECVFNIYHLNDYKMFKKSGERFSPINPRIFVSQLFDYNTVYKKIQDFVNQGNKITTNHLKGTNDIQIVIPNTIKDYFTPDELPYAEGIIREQCARNADKAKANVIYTQLSDLKSLAHEQAEAKKKADREAELEKKRKEEEKKRKQAGRHSNSEQTLHNSEDNAGG